MTARIRHVFVAEASFSNGESIDRICSSLKMAVAAAMEFCSDYDLTLKPDICTVRRALRVHPVYTLKDDKHDVSVTVWKRRLF